MEQTEIALFWVESSPLQWNRIARTVSASRGLDAWENARLFGLLNMALADGYVATFATKYHYNFWRPVTAIREADSDGNPDTVADPAWTPLAPTPPIPDHDSGHSVEGGAAAQVLKRFFDSDRSVQHMQPDAAARIDVRRCVPRAAVVRQLYAGGRRERALAHPRRISFPERGRRRDSARPGDRQPRR